MRRASRSFCGRMTSPAYPLCKLRRRIPLPDVAADCGPQPVTIGGEARRLSPMVIDALRWLFDHDPTTLRALHTGLTSRHGQDSTDAAIRELLRFGFLAWN